MWHPRKHLISGSDSLAVPEDMVRMILTFDESCQATGGTTKANHPRNNPRNGIGYLAHLRSSKSISALRQRRADSAIGVEHPSARIPPDASLALS